VKRKDDKTAGTALSNSTPKRVSPPKVYNNAVQASFMEDFVYGGCI